MAAGDVPPGSDRPADVDPPSAPASVRLARISDAPAMASVMVDTWLVAHRGQVPDELWQRNRDEWTHAESERSWRTLLEEIDAGRAPEECVYVAVDAGGEVVGVALGRPSELAMLENAAEAGPIYVLPAYQGHGLGRSLVRAVAAHQATLGRQALVISVLAANADSRKFYEALGGRIVGEHETEDFGFPLPQVVYGWDDIHVFTR